MIQLPEIQSADQVGRVAQIIVAALILGQVAFAGLALVIAQDENPPPNRKFPFPMAIVGVVVGTVQIGLRFIIPGIISSSSLRRLKEHQPTDWRLALASVYLAATFAAHALLEGAGLFNGVIFMVENHWVNLAVMGVMVALMAITFPSQSKFETWAEQVQRDHS